MAATARSPLPSPQYAVGSAEWSGNGTGSLDSRVGHPMRLRDMPLRILRRDLMTRARTVDTASLTCVPLWASTLLLKKTALDQGWAGGGEKVAQQRSQVTPKRCTEAPEARQFHREPRNMQFAASGPLPSEAAAVEHANPSPKWVPSLAAQNTGLHNHTNPAKGEAADSPRSAIPPDCGTLSQC